MTMKGRGDLKAMGPTGRAWHRVAMADTDASGRLYWAAPFRMFEKAEVELWRSLDALDVYWSLPRVRAEVQYLAPLQRDDNVLVEASLLAVGTTSVRVGFRLLHGSTLAGTGSTVAVWVDANGRPRELRGLLAHVTPADEGGQDETGHAEDR